MAPSIEVENRNSGDAAVNLRRVSGVLLHGEGADDVLDEGLVPTVRGGQPTNGDHVNCQCSSWSTASSSPRYPNDIM